MLLFIDTSDRDKIVVGLGEKRFETQSTQEKSQMLLPFIDKVLEKEGKNLKDITKIEVNNKKGSFTGLRVGVTVAETLGWALKVPVNKKRIYKGESIKVNYGK